MPTRNLPDLLRKQIHRQKLSQYKIAMDTGIKQPSLSRFLNGGSLKMETAAVLLDYLPAWGLLAMIPSVFLIAPLRWAMIGPERPVPEQALGANVIWNLATNVVLAGALLL